MSNLIALNGINNQVGLGTNLISLDSSNDSALEFKNDNNTLLNFNTNNNTLQVGIISSNSIWQGTPIELAYGGIGSLGIGSANQVLQVNSSGTNLEWNTITTSGGTVDASQSSNIATNVNSGTNVTLGNSGVDLSINSKTLNISIGSTTPTNGQILKYNSSTQSLNWSDRTNVNIDSLWSLMKYLHPGYVLLLKSINVTNPTDSSLYDLSPTFAINTRVYTVDIVLNDVVNITPNVFNSDETTPVITGINTHYQILNSKYYLFVPNTSFTINTGSNSNIYTLNIQRNLLTENTIDKLIFNGSTITNFNSANIIDYNSTNNLELEVYTYRNIKNITLQEGGAPTYLNFHTKVENGDIIGIGSIIPSGNPPTNTYKNYIINVTSEDNTPNLYTMRLSNPPNNTTTINSISFNSSFENKSNDGSDPDVITLINNDTESGNVVFNKSHTHQNIIFNNIDKINNNLSTMEFNVVLSTQDEITNQEDGIISGIGTYSYKIIAPDGINESITKVLKIIRPPSTATDVNNKEISVSSNTYVGINTTHITTNNKFNIRITSNNFGQRYTVQNLNTGFVGINTLYSYNSEIEFEDIQLLGGTNNIELMITPQDRNASSSTTNFDIIKGYIEAFIISFNSSVLTSSSSLFSTDTTTETFTYGIARDHVNFQNSGIIINSDTFPINEIGITTGGSIYYSPIETISPGTSKIYNVTITSQYENNINTYSYNVYKKSNDATLTNFEITNNSNSFTRSSTSDFITSNSTTTTIIDDLIYYNNSTLKFTTNNSYIKTIIIENLINSNNILNTYTIDGVNTDSGRTSHTTSITSLSTINKFTVTAEDDTTETYTAYMRLLYFIGGNNSKSSNIGYWFQNYPNKLLTNSSSIDSTYFNSLSSFYELYFYGNAYVKSAGDYPSTILSQSSLNENVFMLTPNQTQRVGCINIGIGTKKIKKFKFTAKIDDNNLLNGAGFGVYLYSEQPILGSVDMASYNATNSTGYSADYNYINNTLYNFNNNSLIRIEINTEGKFIKLVGKPISNNISTDNNYNPDNTIVGHFCDYTIDLTIAGTITIKAPISVNNGSITYYTYSVNYNNIGNPSTDTLLIIYSETYNTSNSHYIRKNTELEFFSNTSVSNIYSLFNNVSKTFYKLTNAVNEDIGYLNILLDKTKLVQKIQFIGRITDTNNEADGFTIHLFGKSPMVSNNLKTALSESISTGWTDYNNSVIYDGGIIIRFLTYWNRIEILGSTTNFLYYNFDYFRNKNYLYDIELIRRPANEISINIKIVLLNDLTQFIDTSNMSVDITLKMSNTLLQSNESSENRYITIFSQCGGENSEHHLLDTVKLKMFDITGFHEYKMIDITPQHTPQTTTATNIPTVAQRLNNSYNVTNILNFIGGQSTRAAGYNWWHHGPNTGPLPIVNNNSYELTEDSNNKVGSICMLINKDKTPRKFIFTGKLHSDVGNMDNWGRGFEVHLFSHSLHLSQNINYNITNEPEEIYLGGEEIYHEITVGVPNSAISGNIVNSNGNIKPTYNDNSYGTTYHPDSASTINNANNHALIVKFMRTWGLEVMHKSFVGNGGSWIGDAQITVSTPLKEWIKDEFYQYSIELETLNDNPNHVDFNKTNLIVKILSSTGEPLDSTNNPLGGGEFTRTREIIDINLANLVRGNENFESHRYINIVGITDNSGGGQSQMTVNKNIQLQMVGESTLTTYTMEDLTNSVGINTIPSRTTRLNF